MTITEFLLGRVPLLAGLTAEQAGSLAAAADQQTYIAGQTILFRGTTVDGLFVVATGRVAVWVKSPKGGALVQAAELGVGDVFGETSILENGTAGATIKATDETLVFMIPQDAFRQVLASNPDLQARADGLVAARRASNDSLGRVPAAV